MLVFWDIDGTLLTTGGAGIFAWEDALLELTGVGVHLGQFDTAGHPDHGIAHRLLAEYVGVEPESGQVTELVRRYEDRLPRSLHRRRGRVLPNVREVLEGLEREPGARSLLLTGNTDRGARAKLAHYGLLDFFQDGGFSDGHGDRAAIARVALERAGAAGCLVPGGRVYVIGDTPHDVRCGAAIGARTIAVATGRHSVDELAQGAPWRVLPQLPPWEEFLVMLRDEVSADV
jgi:phosphoglycolate phosphatase-like HAD superfamily hydrolase